MSDRLDSRRVTIADIARRAGVSKGAVSYALNGRPGLSDVTRAHEACAMGSVVTLGDSAISGEAGRWAGNTNQSSSRVDALGRKGQAAALQEYAGAHNVRPSS